MQKKIIYIAGAGLAGCTLARHLADHGYKVIIYERRSHFAGNCFDERCEHTGIMLHKYGPHIFHTDNPEVYEFISRFTTLKNYRHTVKTTAAGRVWSLPVNLHTLNQYWQTSLSPAEARKKLDSEVVTFKHLPSSLEEQAQRLMGKGLYELFIKHYTEKQWGRPSSQIPAHVLSRLPFRFDYSDNYFSQRWQGIPDKGYTEMVRRIVTHSNITVKLNTSCPKHLMKSAASTHHLFWTGPLDAFFFYSEGRLPYRTLEFEEFISDGDWQGCSVMNYADPDVPWTRITEHKHFMPEEKHVKTVCFREYSREASGDDELYYPVHLAAQSCQTDVYVEKAKRLRNVSFLGRLGTFRYQDMDAVIGDALQMAEAYMSGCPNTLPEGL
ncbi:MULTISPECIES: UDP-galactopyranose mutase [Enterobacter]|uniref:UDP-galactopyranose mutase n=1 Tax=Enterobacter TaxID=547 RepID=UPI0007B360C0|nr:MULTISPECIES: UDP-galactopyranose mutase [Enterobacter]KZQ36092.1 hypothetical protein A3464_06800 [Enterobacter genomosp. O]MBS0865800.1 UDP-galactopyranose mutase [Enterobacter mori]